MNIPLDGERSTYIIRSPDPDGFRMPNRFYRKNSCDYELMFDRYNKLDNKPRFAGEIIPIGIEYGNITEPTAEW